MGDREELTPEDARRWMDQGVPGACVACGATVGRGIERCQRCQQAGRQAATCEDCGVGVPGGKSYCADCGQRRLAALPQTQPGASVRTGDVVAEVTGGVSFVAVMWGLTAIGFFVAFVTADDPWQQRGYAFGVSLASVAVIGLIARAAILSALRAFEAERKR